MKEFINKLIGRLEEIYNRNDKAKKEAYEKQDWEYFDLFSHRNEGVYTSISIVNQLAEEYNNDCCEWRIGEYGDSWKPNCCDEIYYLRGVRKFKFCPYCGKKIKIGEVING